MDGGEKVYERVVLEVNRGGDVLGEEDRGGDKVLEGVLSLRRAKRVAKGVALVETLREAREAKGCDSGKFRFLLRLDIVS